MIDLTLGLDVPLANFGVRHHVRFSVPGNVGAVEGVIARRYRFKGTNRVEVRGRDGNLYDCKLELENGRAKENRAVRGLSVTGILYGGAKR